MMEILSQLNCDIFELEDMWQLISRNNPRVWAADIYKSPEPHYEYSTNYVKPNQVELIRKLARDLNSYPKG